MKQLILKSKYVFVIALITFISSCNKDDGPVVPEVKSPTVSYAVTTFDAIFGKEGSSEAPSVEWNNEKGLFSLSEQIEGLSINTSTGVLSWTSLLPIATHNVTVIAKNSAGQTAINIKINNPFQGTFIGTAGPSGELYREFIFKTDGTLEIRLTEGGDLVSGSFELDGNIIKAKYIIPNTFLANWSFDGTIDQKVTGVNLNGNYYAGLEANGNVLFTYTANLK